MIDIVNKRCSVEGCQKQPYFGLPLDKRPSKCFEHKSETMVDIVSKKCDFPTCKSRPVFGLPGSKTATKCCAHKSQLMVNVQNKKCTGCGLLFRANKLNIFLCGYCRPQTVVRAKKEKIVKELLETKLSEFRFIHDKQFNNECCLKYRPDFLFDRGSYFLIAECDENGHEGYDQYCEIVRMNSISFGLGLPTKFIRYNPDLKGVSTKIKHQKLIETLKHWLTMDLLIDPSPLYLFYSESS
jgi:hypothetical protein